MYMEVLFVFIKICSCKLYLFTPHQYNIIILKPVCVTQVFVGSAG